MARWLIEQGWNPPEVLNPDPYAPWRIRAELATHRIEDPQKQAEYLHVAFMHMARHRGWRNPYATEKSLLASVGDSAYMSALRERARDMGSDAAPDATPAQVIASVVLDPSRRMRGPEGFLGGKLHQSDNAEEIRRIIRVQELGDEVATAVILQLFKAESPRGANAGRAGRDPLPGQGRRARAQKASLAFQRHRMLNVLTNLRIAVPESKRQVPLTQPQLEKVFRYLWDADVAEVITWVDVAELLGIEISQLKGLSVRTDDGESATARPPRNVTAQRVAGCKVKELIAWWKRADEESREALVAVVTGEAGDEESSAIDGVLDFISGLGETSQEKVQTLDLGRGRSSYSIDSLNRMSDRMLREGVDLHEARKREFGVPDDWHPPADPIGTPIGNPAVDRVLRIIANWLEAIEQQFGSPTSINIEHVRGGLGSEAMARELTREQEKRRNANEKLAKELIEKELISKQQRASRTDLIRYQALQVQNCQCLYCGATISFGNCELDHIVPRKGVGSSNRRANLVAVCIRCNRSKKNMLFSFWAQHAAPEGVSLKEAVERTRFWIKPSWMSAPEYRALKREVTERLKRKNEDPEFDGRSLESVAWMATELHRRIAAHYGEDTKVRVFNGRTTALARKASGIEKRICYMSGPGKTRLDKRHHAVDAAVIAMMRSTVAQVLAEREELRTWQQLSGEPETWKEYRGKPEQEFQYNRWRKNMLALQCLVQEALDSDSIPLRANLRLRLGHGKAHDDTVRPLKDVRRVGDAIPAEIIERASTPGLYCALTRRSDYSAVDGLPADPERTLTVNGTRLDAQSQIKFFPSDKASILLRGGYADIGNTLHHARIYRFTVGRKEKFGFIRVYQQDLLKHAREDLFSVKLPRQSISVRTADEALKKAFVAGDCDYLGWLVPGDEVLLKPGNPLPALEELLSLYPQCLRWTISGFEDKRRINLRPKLLAEEGLSDDAPKTVKQAFERWRPAFNVFMECDPTVIRRDVLGRPRVNSNSGLPNSWRIRSGS